VSISGIDIKTLWQRLFGLVQDRFYRAHSEENEYPLYQNQNYYDDGYYNPSKRVRTVRQPVLMIPQRFQVMPVMYRTPVNHYYQDDHDPVG
jgi:hypothetical protein